MERRQLGKTGEYIPVIGMGTWKMGSAVTEERLEELRALRRGIELGMNLIDTAEMYGQGSAETTVGEAIKGKRDSVFIATKVWPDNLHYDDVIRACERSLSRLGTRYIDLYQVHWPNPRIPMAETMSAMEKLVNVGKVRYIGVSNFNVKQIQEAQDSLSKNELVSNQIEYSLVSRSVEKDILPYCENHRLTVIAYSPLARGAIPESKIPKTLLSKYNMTPAQLMLNWVTVRENIVAIPKASRTNHVEENAFSVARRLSPSDYRLLSQAFS